MLLECGGFNAFCWINWKHLFYRRAFEQKTINLTRDFYFLSHLISQAFEQKNEIFAKLSLSSSPAGLS